MDRLWTENRWFRLADLKRETWIRRSAAKNIAELPEWLHIFACDHTATELSSDYGWLNGTNSGLCGLNWAYQKLLATGGHIILFGYDMCRGPKGEVYWWREPYPWANPEGGTGNKRYAEWAAQFARAAAQCKEANIEVINASTVSAIKAFPKMDPREAVATFGAPVAA